MSSAPLARTNGAIRPSSAISSRELPDRLPRATSPLTACLQGTLGITASGAHCSWSEASMAEALKVRNIDLHGRNEGGSGGALGGRRGRGEGRRGGDEWSGGREASTGRKRGNASIPSKKPKPAAPCRKADNEWKERSVRGEEGGERNNTQPRAQTTGPCRIA